MAMLTEMGPESNSAQQWHEWLAASLRPVEVTYADVRSPYVRPT